VIAVAGVVALVGAIGQLIASRLNAKRERVYEYADRITERGMLRTASLYMDAWESATYEEFKALDREARTDWLMLPNLVEEIAFLYNRRLLARNVAAELLGMYVEDLWSVSVPLVVGLRQERNDPTVYSEWEDMQRDVPHRRSKEVRKAARRRARRKLFRGD
jgi:hypothetical protein